LETKLYKTHHTTAHIAPCFPLRLFQNFSFWNSFLRFKRKTGLLAGFSKSLSIGPEVRTNRVLKQAPFFFLFLTAFFYLPESAALWGQETGYRIEDDGSFVQFLNWEGRENVLYYEVEIEKQAGALWEGALTGQMEAPFFEFSLEPGIYRYRVRSYDFLARPGPASAWIQFEIFPARQPELLRFSPEGFYLDEDPVWVITITGRNLTEGSELFLEESQGNIIRPDTVALGPSGSEARLTFRYDQLDMGSYVIHAINPGGLTTETQTFRIAFRKPVDVSVSAGYKPLIFFYGYINELFETPFFPVGAYSRLSIIPLKQLWGYVGIEIEPFWHYLQETGNTYEAQAQMPGAAIYGVYRRWFSNRVLTLDFRVGGGIYSVLDYHFTFDRGSTEPVTALIPAIAAGVSLQWLVRKPFYMEAGVDFTHFFTPDQPSPGYLRPFAGVGWQF
jgi:hypothetical protein